MSFVRTSHGLGAILAWFGLAIQFNTTVLASTSPNFMHGFLTYTGYFTVWGNLLAALAFTASFFKDGTRLKKLFILPPVRGAIALYLLVICFVYHGYLSDNHSPDGWAVIGNITLHTAVPVLFIADWFFFANKRDLFYRHIPLWVLVPFIYGLINIGRSKVSGFDPYPFLDINLTGNVRFLLNAGAFIAAFSIGAAIFIATGRYLEKSSRNSKV